MVKIFFIDFGLKFTKIHLINKGSYLSPEETLTSSNENFIEACLGWEASNPPGPGSSSMILNQGCLRASEAVYRSYGFFASILVIKSLTSGLL
jgi:hypothetical protein